ncbi:hypothetical protein M407DRAFT_241419 [Tulasnella calospora MUT 4182]|uniref:Uncharacterized protein n=1 Tax=Tulasnella calospora MUT 4182 TaxID=1051891 RepID=A0A0C3LF00_9AGAM|nr:hypothetical protein M407DRAFT_241419 [Tulasnella calospora MUT 4182]
MDVRACRRLRSISSPAPFTIQRELRYTSGLSSSRMHSAVPLFGVAAAVTQRVIMPQGRVVG